MQNVRLSSKLQEMFVTVFLICIQGNNLQSCDVCRNTSPSLIFSTARKKLSQTFNGIQLLKVILTFKVACKVDCKMACKAVSNFA